MLFVRTNGPRSHHIRADVTVAHRASIDGIIVPKLEAAADLQIFDAATPIIGIIETARGVTNVEMLADQARDRLAALALGAEDFVTDVGLRLRRAVSWCFCQRQAPRIAPIATNEIAK